jgi:hypothetical protein
LYTGVAPVNIGRSMLDVIFSGRAPLVARPVAGERTPATLGTESVKRASAVLAATLRRRVIRPFEPRMSDVEGRANVMTPGGDFAF